MPDIPIMLFTDRPMTSEIFDQIVKIESPYYGYEDKVRHIGHSPYRDTLYLDSDTALIDDVRELFLLLERFDLAAAHAPCGSYKVATVPECFPEFNVGVILFRRSEAIQRLFDSWLAIYKEDSGKNQEWLYPGLPTWYQGVLPEQPAFRRAIYDSALRVRHAPARVQLSASIPWVRSIESQDSSRAGELRAQGGRGAEQGSIAESSSYALGEIAHPG